MSHDVAGQPDLLVVGAGPTGLTLAAQAAAHGARVRIIERRPHLVRESRAVVIHPRTLEMLRPLGVADDLVRRGDPNAAFQVHFPGRRSKPRGVAGGRLAPPRGVAGVHAPARQVVTGRLAGLGLDDTSYPFLLVIAQVETESVLSEHLHGRGLAVERGVELVNLEQDEIGLVCTLSGPGGGLERVLPGYVVGCDGVGSTVRRHSAIGFAGGFYPYPLVLADLEVAGLAPDTAHAFVAAPGILFFFPIGRPATWRMLAARPPGCDGSESLEQLQAIADAFTDGRVLLNGPVWRSELWLQRRLSAQYRDRRVFLAGDAAHVHSPAIAQGMNAGIRDACNLGWKLALVSRGLAAERLLDSYEAEHRPLARLLRAATDVAFAVETGDQPWARLIRTRLAPFLTPVGLGSDRAVAALARTVAGLRFTYRGSPAIQDRPRGRPGAWARRSWPRPGGSWWVKAGLAGRGQVRPGDRLPDVPLLCDGQPVSLHQALASPGFHLLLCGPRDGLVTDRASNLGRRYDGLVRVHWLSRAEVPGALFDDAGIGCRRLAVRRFAYLLIRPDGYIAARGEDGCLRAARDYLATWFS